MDIEILILNSQDSKHSRAVSWHSQIFGTHLRRTSPSPKSSNGKQDTRHWRKAHESKACYTILLIDNKDSNSRWVRQKFHKRLETMCFYVLYIYIYMVHTWYIPYQKGLNTGDLLCWFSNLEDTLRTTLLSLSIRLESNPSMVRQKGSTNVPPEIVD